jgi:hypothetical protein
VHVCADDATKLLSAGCIAGRWELAAYVAYCAALLAASWSRACTAHSICGRVRQQAESPRFVACYHPAPKWHGAVRQQSNKLLAVLRMQSVHAIPCNSMLHLHHVHRVTCSAVQAARSLHLVHTCM